MSYKQNRPLSFVIVAISYLIATAVGIGVFFALFAVELLWLKILISDIAATIIIFIISLFVDNASLYDPYWSVQPMIIVPLVFAYTGSVTIGAIIIIAVIEIWGVRLTGNWAYLFKNIGEQDWRYTNIKKTTGALYPIVDFCGIMLIPTLIVFACLFPIIMFAESGAVFSPIIAVGAALCLLGIALEIVADHQKHKFRKDGNRGIVNIGLWAKWRHPNYIGEVLMWWGAYVMIVCACPSLWWTFFGALCNTLLFLFISIPMAEKQSALRHVEEWAEYKKSTRYFI